MKILILTALISSSAFAVRMCPVRTMEIVSCKEQGSIAISICEYPSEEIVMTYKHPAYPEVEMYPAARSEDLGLIIFKRTDIAPESMELAIRKSVDDHTRGVFKYSTAGVQAQLAMRCLTRYIDQ